MDLALSVQRRCRCGRGRGRGRRSRGRRGRFRVPSLFWRTRGQRRPVRREHATEYRRSSKYSLSRNGLRGSGTAAAAAAAELDRKRDQVGLELRRLLLRGSSRGMRRVLVRDVNDLRRRWGRKRPSPREVRINVAQRHRRPRRQDWRVVTVRDHSRRRRKEHRHRRRRRRSRWRWNADEDEVRSGAGGRRRGGRRRRRDLRDERQREVVQQRGRARRWWWWCRRRREQQGRRCRARTRSVREGATAKDATDDVSGGGRSAALGIRRRWRRVLLLLREQYAMLNRRERGDSSPRAGGRRRKTVFARRERERREFRRAGERDAVRLTRRRRRRRGLLRLLVVCLRRVHVRSARRRSGNCARETERDVNCWRGDERYPDEEAGSGSRIQSQESIRACRSPGCCACPEVGGAVEPGRVAAAVVVPEADACICSSWCACTGTRATTGGRCM